MGYNPELTRKERKVCELVKEGLNNYAIGDEMGIKEQTVCSHLQHIYDKLGVCERSQLLFLLLKPKPTGVAE